MLEMEDINALEVSAASRETFPFKNHRCTEAIADPQRGRTGRPTHINLMPCCSLNQ